jgi:hypothetical protein
MVLLFRNSPGLFVIIRLILQSRLSKYWATSGCAPKSS